MLLSAQVNLLSKAAGLCGKGMEILIHMTGKTGIKVLNTVALLLLIFSLLLCGCGKDAKPELGAIKATVMIASDTHLLADSLSGSEKYAKGKLTSDGRVQELDTVLLKSLAAKANELCADALCITGDLSFNGERASHEQISQILSSVNTYTKVLVIPGNHDCYNQNAYSYANDERKHLNSISYDYFIENYAAFGYSGALSYDSTGLSYIWELSGDVWLMMLNTTLSKFNDEFGMTVTGGYIEDETVDWIRDKLEYAHENGIMVIPFTHHNLVTHNSVFENGYTLQNADVLVSLFREYGVNLNFSGHLHIQSIAEDSGFYDIASGGLLDYGNRYGILEIYENGFVYNAVPIEIEDMDLKAYSFDVFCSKYEKKHPQSSFAAKINAYYFDGDYSEVQHLIKENPQEAEAIRQNGSDYIRSILEVPSVSQQSLIVLRLA